MTCENSQVIFSVAALDAYSIEYIEQIVDRGILLFLARFIEDYMSPVHHQKPRAVLNGVAQIVRHHDRRQVLFPTS